MMDSKRIDELVINLKYDEAIQLLNQLQLNKSMCQDLFLDVAHDTNSISILGFLLYLLDMGWEKIFIYDCVSLVFTLPLCYYEGGYSLGLFYCKKMLAEEPSPGNLQFFLLFNDIPEKLIDDQTAVRAAKRILESNPDDVTALETMKRRTAKVDTVDLSDETVPFWEISMYDKNMMPNWEMFFDAVCYTRYADAEAMLLHDAINEQTRLDWILAATVWNTGDEHYGGNLAVVGFLMYLLDEGWDKARVYRWLVLTLNASDSIDGAYGLALFYCRKLVAEEETLDNLRLLLSFVDAPGDFMGRDEAEDVARRILALDANDAKARDVLELVGGAD